MQQVELILPVRSQIVKGTDCLGEICNEQKIAIICLRRITVKVCEQHSKILMLEVLTRWLLNIRIRLYIRHYTSLDPVSNEGKRLNASKASKYLI